MKRMIWGMCLLALTAGANDFPESRPAEANKFAVPAALKAEHKELQEKMEQATQSGGATGQKAREVARLLSAHFAKEERFALPPLGLLQPMTSGSVTTPMQEVLPLTKTLRSELPQMLKEHKVIVKALQELRAAAEREKHAPVVEFTKTLQHHAEMEEQVLYPAALLVGQVVEMKSAR